jgi:hypothetical protein
MFFPLKPTFLVDVQSRCLGTCRRTLARWFKPDVPGWVTDTATRPNQTPTRNGGIFIQFLGIFQIPKSSLLTIINHY